MLYLHQVGVIISNFDREVISRSFQLIDRSDPKGKEETTCKYQQWFGDSFLAWRR
jgi:hypothetical protein